MWKQRSFKFFLVILGCVFSTQLCQSFLLNHELPQQQNDYKTGSLDRLFLELENKQIESNDDGNLWVVLAAGSDGWYNYRHQADICHAYQIVRSHGVPDERIIVFMRDDIAYNEANPQKGVIINQPNGTNVYPGVPKDYTDYYLRPSIFLDVLSGKRPDFGSHKTLKTGPNDRIFVYFADHGGPGISMFGDDMLHATNLTNTIRQMHKDKKYKEMVIYWESCHSGSMFQNLLPNNINVYALSASSPTEESYACYRDKTIQNYLGDCFSVHWMEDADIENLQNETLLHQYLIIRYETNTSHVEQWGSKFLMDQEKMANYLGSQHSGGQKYLETSPSTLPSKISQHGNMHPVRQSDVTLDIIKMKLKNSKDFYERKILLNSLHTLKWKRKYMKETINKLLSTAIGLELQSYGKKNILKALRLSKYKTAHTTRETLENCFYPIVKIFHDNCFQLTCNDYAIYQVKEFLPLCKAGITVDSLRKSVNLHCKFEKPICGTY